MTLSRRNYFSVFTINICLIVSLCTFKSCFSFSFCLSPKQSWVTDCHFQLQSVGSPDMKSILNIFPLMDTYWGQTGSPYQDCTWLSPTYSRLLMWLMGWQRQLYRKLLCDLLWQSLADSEEVYSNEFVLSFCPCASCCFLFRGLHQAKIWSHSQHYVCICIVNCLS